MIEEIIKKDAIKAEQIFSQSDNKIELIKNILLSRTFNYIKEDKKKDIINFTSNIVNISSKKDIKKIPRISRKAIINLDYNWNVKSTRKLFNMIDTKAGKK